MTEHPRRFIETWPDIVRVRVASAQGSTPRDAGAEMFVSPGAIAGTIGGGQLEYLAIEHARVMLASGRDVAQRDIPLGPEIGQCCGGRVGLAFARIGPDARAGIIAGQNAARAAWPVLQIHGAGHVGRALAGFVAQLPVRAVLIDSRVEELDLCTAPAKRRLTPLPEAEIRAAPPGSAFVILTHDHALDFLLASEALSRRDAAYIGLIGSATKRRRFEKFHAERSPDIDVSRLICPIGSAGSADKRPAVIAAFVTAEIMAALTRHPSRTNASAD